MSGPEFFQESFVPRQRWKIGLSVFISILALASILGMMNSLASRHYERWQWSAGSRPQLSPASLFVLAALTNDVKIIAFYDRREPLSDLVSDL